MNGVPITNDKAINMLAVVPSTLTTGSGRTGVELARYPDHGLAGGQNRSGPESRSSGSSTGRRLRTTGLGGLASAFILGRRATHSCSDGCTPKWANSRMDDERHAPAPVRKRGFANGGTGTQNHHQRQEQAQRGGGLNPGGVGTTFALRRMLGHVGGSATVLTTPSARPCSKRKHDQDHRGGHANAGVGRQNTHHESGQAHDQDGDQEGVLATNHVAQAAKHQRTERTHDETGSESQQREDEGGTFVQAREELFGNDGCERAVQVEVIPFEKRYSSEEAKITFFSRASSGGRSSYHVLSPRKKKFTSKMVVGGLSKGGLTLFRRTSNNNRQRN